METQKKKNLGQRRGQTGHPVNVVLLLQQGCCFLLKNKIKLQKTATPHMITLIKPRRKKITQMKKITREKYNNLQRFSAVFLSY